ncbi:unnamed protein product [Callosobruchus maculatus]|uniref:Uncharacterized protein n=1 Tax=Callosobruchus maculatus TaxID=64391 RepID=A0A653CTG8_CALMS|nr:unnamed protein product [Callosobruchus maculatus]
MKLNQQLLFIQRDLACKEALAKQLLENNKSIVDIQEMADNELKIAQLEKEKSELVQKLKQVGNSGKMAEHHRKRVQELEGQLAQLNKKLKEQSNILRMKEREGERIKKLNEEILQMKQMKVKLIRSMREEAEKYRRWRTEKERMCAKLKQQERKKDNELAKIKAMHSKQQIVFKRRVEQAEALNRRLKSALSLRQQVHETKKGKQEEKLEPWLKQEYDLYISLVEARATLSTLLEDRATLQHVLDEMKDSANADPAQIKSDAICGHKEVLEFHTQTITSQEQKIDELKNQIEELLKEMENLKQHQQRPVQQPVIKKTEQSNAEESSVVVKTEDQDENAPPGKLRRTRRLFHMGL